MPKEDPIFSQKKTEKLMRHITELRSRLIRCSIVLVLFFCLFYYFSRELYHTIALPLIHNLPTGATIIATSIASPFLIPLKLCVAMSFFFTMPYLLYNVWGFVAPGLYKREKKFGAILLLSSILLFYVGLLFAYFVILPMAFTFFAHVAPEGVKVLPDIKAHFDFTLKVFYAFGIVFEVPVVVVILTHTNLVSVDALKKQRRYVIFAAFVLAMFLTPPDVFSQILFAIPLILLFELGLLAARILKISSSSREANNI